MRGVRQLVELTDPSPFLSSPLLDLSWEPWLVHGPRMVEASELRDPLWEGFSGRFIPVHVREARCTQRRNYGVTITYCSMREFAMLGYAETPLQFLSYLDEVLAFLDNSEMKAKHPVLKLASLASNAVSNMQKDSNKWRACPHFPTSPCPRTGCGGAGSEARRCALGAGEE